MAVVGDAYVYVRAITTNVIPDIERGLSGVNSVAERAGRQLSQGINSGFRSTGNEFLDDLSDKLEKSRQQFRKLNNIVRFVGPAVAGLAGAIGALVGGLVVLVAAAGSAARTLIVLPASLFALAQGAIAARLAFRGVGEAISAGLKDQQGSAAASRAQAAALKRVTDAQLALKRLLEEEAPEVLAAARERAADAARAAADALLGAERTQRSYNEAQRDSLSAIEDLNNARDRAREKLQQLRFELEGAAIGESRARLEFEKARDSLQAVQDLPPNSRARQEAELAFAQAELNLRKAIDNNADLKKEEDAASRAGVEGSQDVLAAKEALAQAQQKEADLAIDTARAFERAAEAQRDAAQAAAAAAAGGTVERELNRRIAEARDALREAEQAAADAAAGGLSAYQQALAKLSPEARAFVELLVTLEREFKAFSQFGDAAGRLLFPQLTTAVLTFLSAAEPIKQLLEETGGVVGEFANNLSTALFTGEGFESLRSVWTTNNTLLSNLGQAAINLSLAFLEILEAAEPLITAFGEWAESKSAGFLARLREDGDELSKTFENAERNLKNFATLFGNIFEGFGIIGDVVNEEGGAADTLLGGLISRSETWLAGLRQGAEDGSLDEYFTNLSTNFLLLFDAVAELVDVLLELGAQEGLGPFLVSLKDAITIFGDVGKILLAPGGPAEGLGKFAVNFSELILALTQGDALTTFFETLNNIIEPFVDFLQRDDVQAFLARFSPIIAQFAAFGLVFRSVRFVVEAFLGTLLLLASPFLIIFGIVKLLTSPLGALFLAPLVPMLKFLAIAALVIGFFIAAYNNSEAFRTSVSNFLSTIGEGFSNLWEVLKITFAEVGAALSRLGEFFGFVFGSAGDGLATVFDILAELGSALFGIFGGVAEIIGGVITAVIGIISFFANLVRTIMLGVRAIFTGEFDKIGDAWDTTVQGLIDIFRGAFRIIAGIIRAVLEAIRAVWNSFAALLTIKLPAWLGGGTFSLPKIPPLPPFATPFARGGTVFPQPGGILAQIGEAGRPERIEPLDPDGLSKRDKAMIDRLTGGGAGATINVYPSPGMDERELANLVSRKLAYQMRRGSV